jgi:hypothetical protein
MEKDVQQGRGLDPSEVDYSRCTSMNNSSAVLYIVVLVWIAL